MGISTRQYQDIMNEYDAVRRRNYMAEQERKERIYALIPEIRRIDEEIAHVSVAKAKEMLLKKISNAYAKKSLQSTIYDLSMEKVNCWRFMIIRQIILIRSMTAQNVRIPAISEIKSVIVSS